MNVAQQVKGDGEQVAHNHDPNVQCWNADCDVYKALVELYSIPREVEPIPPYSMAMRFERVRFFHRDGSRAELSVPRVVDQPARCRLPTPRPLNQVWKVSDGDGGCRWHGPQFTKRPGVCGRCIRRHLLREHADIVIPLRRGAALLLCG